MAQRNMAEFVSIVQPIVDEYLKGITDVNVKFINDLTEKVSDMDAQEAKVLYTMVESGQDEIAKIIGG